MKTSPSINNLVAYLRVLPLIIFVMAFGMSASQGVIEVDFQDTVTNYQKSSSADQICPFSGEFVNGSLATGKTVNAQTTTPPAPSSKNPAELISAAIARAEILFQVGFTQYNQLLESSFFKDRKADFLFPFHYFW